MDSIKIYNKHYIKIDIRNRIIDGWSDGPHFDKNITDAICINENGGYQFKLFQDGEENPLLFTFEGVPLYCWDGNKVIQRTAEEIQADIIAIPPSPPTELEQIRADIDFISVMTDVEL